MAGNGAARSKPASVRVITGAKAVGQFVPALTKKAFERYGFPAAALLTDWKAIAGADLAAWTRPERLKWPKGGDDEEAGAARGATLLLRVDGPRSIEVQMRGRQLIERINAYFGFGAVGELRIMQAPLTARAAPRPTRTPVNAARTPVDVSGVEDGALRAALERLSEGVAKSGIV